MLFAVKFVHSAVFLVVSAAIFYVWYAIFAAEDQTDTGLLWASVAVILLETAVYLGNGARCPLTHLARHYGDERGDDFIADIFLPAWFVPLVPPVCGALAVLGLIVLGARILLN